RYMDTLKFTPYETNGATVAVTDVVMSVVYRLKD
ncbi:MAG: hypothetical protein ACI883_000301, partial [Candidatus Azotimanducaceae bacterium]